MNIKRALSVPSVLILGSAFVVAACGGSSSTQVPGASSVASNGGNGPEVTLPPMPGVGGGSCQVKLEGDVNISWQEKQSVSSVLVSYWFSPAELKMLNMKEGEATFLFNCVSTGNGSLSVMSTNDTTTEQFKKGPGTYVIPKAGMLGGGEAGQASILLTTGKDTFWRVGEPGTLTVTTLDGKKFAGNIQVKVERMDDELKVDGSAMMTVVFEFGCSSGACG